MHLICKHANNTFYSLNIVNYKILHVLNVFNTYNKQVNKYTTEIMENNIFLDAWVIFLMLQVLQI